MLFDDIRQKEEKKQYFKNLQGFLDEERKTKVIYPPKDEIYNAITKTPLENVKVVIIGQDPYHGENEANGLCFSVNKGIKIPPSLKNIFKELSRDLNVKTPENGDLTSWAEQGVLLLNTVLTVEKDKPASHRNKGWEMFTDEIIRAINNIERPVVFMLWGKDAEKKKSLITSSRHLVLESSHPSPFSVRRGFEGCSHFSKANEFLRENGQSGVKWGEIDR